MCGLTFYCTINKDPQNELEQSLINIEHRGPDARGKIFKKVGKYNIGIGHNRLSILDLSENGLQPMSYEDQTIAYNGEVYNFQELRTYLLEQGYNPKSQSDTEIILLLYAALKEQAFPLLNGMFAFVIVDENSKKLWIVRDKLGIKPIYLYQNNNELFASSEIKGLTAFTNINLVVDPDDVFEFFNQGFLYEPNTGYIGIKKLMPGHYLELDLVTGSCKQIEYAKNIKIEKSLAETVKNAIEKQLIADVPLGTFFSGGTDSTIIASYNKENDLFFAKYDQDYYSDVDMNFSKKIANHLNRPLKTTNLSSSQNNNEQIMEIIDFVAKNTEELISDYTFWPTFQLSKSARNEGYKVMLSGMGGDEVFAGYPRYLILKYHFLIKLFSNMLDLCFKFKLFPKKYAKKIERLVSYCNEKHWPTAYSRLMGYFSRKDLSQLFTNFSALDNAYREKLDRLKNLYSKNTKDKVKLGRFLDLKGFLSHNLMVSDKASMLASLELRVPLLDDNVVAKALDYSSNKLIKGKKLKKPLYDLLKKNFPTMLIKRPKTGFNPPLDGLINNIGKEKLKEEIYKTSTFINVKACDSLLEEHFSKQKNHTYKLWQLLYFSRWLQVNQVIASP